MCWFYCDVSYFYVDLFKSLMMLRSLTSGVVSSNNFSLVGAVKRFLIDFPYNFLNN